MGVKCAVCSVGWDRIGKKCEPCRQGEIAIRLGIVVAFVVVVTVSLWKCRRKLSELHRKFRGTWRAFRSIAACAVSFTQINLALGTTINFEVWEIPPLYTQFLKRFFGLLDLDILPLLGIQCVVDMDYRYSVVFALLTPAAVVTMCLIGYACQRRLLAQSLNTLSTERWQGLLSELFDSADFDNSGTLDQTEVTHLIRSLHKLASRSKAVSRKAVVALMLKAEKNCSYHFEQTLSMAGSTQDATALSGATISREAFLLVTASVANGKSRKQAHSRSSMLRRVKRRGDVPFNTLAEAFPSDLVIRFVLKRNLAATWISVAVQILFLVHAPVSARAFVYFDCAKLGPKHYFLRADYKLGCYEEGWYGFLAVTLLLLCGFALAVPFVLVLFMHRHRHDLHSPSTRQRIGFLMAAYRKEVYWYVIFVHLFSSGFVFVWLTSLPTPPHTPIRFVFFQVGGSRVDQKNDSDGRVDLLAEGNPCGSGHACLSCCHRVAESVRAS